MAISRVPITLPGDPVAALDAAPRQYVDTKAAGGNVLAVGEEVFTRERGDSSTLAVQSQALRLTYFTARKSGTTAQVRVISGTTAAGATPTLCRVGLYLIDGSDGGTLVAATPNDTSLFAAATTAYTRSWAAAYEVTAGQRYALGVLVVTTFATPTIAGYTVGSSMDAETALPPRISGRITGQADLPASFLSGSVLTTLSRYYGVILP